MQQLMKRQHKLILQNNEIMFKLYLEIRVIEQSRTIGAAGTREFSTLLKLYFMY